MAVHVLVLAGGSGTRLWPLSRSGRPKHLLPLGPGGVSLLRATLDRVSGLGHDVHVLTAASQASQCAAELEAAGLEASAIIAEPEARGSGPALGLATALLARRDPEAVIVSVHADARVHDAAAYRDAVVAAAGWATVTGGAATVGLVPPYPSTGMGYIEKGARLDGGDWRMPDGGVTEAAGAAALPAFQAARFLEKPQADVAAGFVAGGNHLWNLGLFAWPAAFFLDSLARADPEVHAAVSRTAALLDEGDTAAAAEAYRGARVAAVEPLLIERVEPLTAVQASFAWSDVGSWQDLYDTRVEEGEGDSAGNVSDGAAIVAGAARTGVFAHGKRLVAVVGVDDLIVVDTDDAVLVVARDQSQRVRELVDRLRDEGRSDLT